MPLPNLCFASRPVALEPLVINAGFLFSLTHAGYHDFECMGFLQSMTELSAIIHRYPMHREYHACGFSNAPSDTPWSNIERGNSLNMLAPHLLCRNGPWRFFDWRSRGDADAVPMQLTLLLFRHHSLRILRARRQDGRWHCSCWTCSLVMDADNDAKVYTQTCARDHVAGAWKRRWRLGVDRPKQDPG